MLGSRHIDPNKLFLAIVQSVDYQRGLCTLSFFRPNDKASNIVVGQPYAGRGWGIFCGVEPGTVCLCALDAERKVYIISYFPDLSWMDERARPEQGKALNEFFYPKVQEGELVFQNKKNAKLALNRYGDVILETPTGDRLVLDATTDSFEAVSAQRIEVCEAFETRAGAIKRDIRSIEEKLQEPLVGTASAFDYSLDPVTEFIGFDPSHKPNAAPALSEELLGGNADLGLSNNVRADIKESFSNLPRGLADLSLGETGSSLYLSDAVNPPLTEDRTIYYEFADSHVGLDQQIVSDELKAAGKFDNNVMGRRVVGTVVNEIGKILSFDYGFDDGKMGHAVMWNTKGKSIHEEGQSTDDFFARDNTLANPQGELRNDREWTVETLERTDAATMFDFTLRTRGVNYAGVPELEDSGGRNFSIRVAKDGLTKLNIPAATSLNANEFFREGRSVLANLDGSLEATIGKQLCTGDKGLDRITGVTDDRANFVNMNNFPNYGRKDRSVALDLLGNLEVLVGGDSNVNQSIMLQADGSLAAFFGKEVLQSPEEGQSKTLATGAGVPISTACLAQDRKDRSITVRTIGNVEAHFHKDAAYEQSTMITTEGGNRWMFGQDKRGRSLDLHTNGGIRVEVQGGMVRQGYALEIDLEGNMHIYVNGKVDIHSTDDMRLQTEKDLHLDVGGDLFAQIGGSENWNVKGDKKTKIEGDEKRLVSGERTTAVTGSDKTKVTQNEEKQILGQKIETITGLSHHKATGGVNIDGGVISINAGASQTTTVNDPSEPTAPRDIYTSSREQPGITVDTDNSQQVPAERESDKTGEAPVTKQLEETIDPKSNRIENPFEEET